MTFKPIFTNLPPKNYDISGVIEYENFRTRRLFQPNEEYDVKSPNRWMKTQIALKNEKVLKEMRKKRDQNSSKKEELINGGKSFPARSSAKDKERGKQSSRRVSHEGGCWETPNCRNWIALRTPMEFYYDYYDINWNGSRRFDGNVNHYYGCFNKTNAQRDRKIRHQTVNQDSKSLFKRDNYDFATLEAKENRETKDRHRGLNVAKLPENLILSKHQGPSGTKAQSDCLNKSFKGLDNQSNDIEKSPESELDLLSSAKFNWREFRDVEQDTSTEENALNWPPVTFYNDPYDLREQREIVRLLKECDDHQERRMKFARDNEANNNNKDNNSLVISNCSTDDSFSPNVKIVIANQSLPNKISCNFDKTTTEKQNLPLGGKNHDLEPIEDLTKITFTLKDKIIVINRSPGKTVEVLFDD